MDILSFACNLASLFIGIIVDITDVLLPGVGDLLSGPLTALLTFCGG